MGMRSSLTIAVVILLSVVPLAAAQTRPDRDGDRLPDRWERRHGLSPEIRSAGGDPDRDGLRNRREHRLGTHPRRADTDRDGLRDRREVRLRTNPRKKDTDRDRLRDGRELELGTNPRRADSDGDGMRDGDELRDGSDPTDARFFGPVRYVDAAGVGGACSDERDPAETVDPARPWCTFQRAAAAAPAGSTVRVRRGTSRPRLTKVARSGWIRFEPHPGEAAVLEGIELDGARMIHIRGFEITGAAARVGILGGSTDVEISDNDIHDLRTGFYLRDGGARITLQRNQVRRMLWADVARKDGYGLSTVSGVWSDLTVADNVFSAMDGDALQIGAVVRTRITGNRISGARVSSANDDHADAIQVSASADRLLIAGNRISDANKAIIVGSSVLRRRVGITIENNVIHDVSTHCMNVYDTQQLVIRHNTCWDTGYGLWLRDEDLSPDTHTTGARVYNNVFGPALRYPTAVDIQIRGFDDWGSEDYNLIAERTDRQTFDVSDLVTPPLRRLFVDVAKRDFAPDIDGRLVDRGRTSFDLPQTDAAGRPRVLGEAPDLGALEAG